MIEVPFYFALIVWFMGLAGTWFSVDYILDDDPASWRRLVIFIGLIALWPFIMLFLLAYGAFLLAARRFLHD